MKLQRQISRVIPQDAITNAKRGEVNGFVRLGLSRTIIYVWALLISDDKLHIIGT